MATIGFSAIGATASGTLAEFEQGDGGLLIASLRGLGHEVVERDSDGITHFVSLDHDKNALKAVASRVPLANRILLVFEPRVVKPANYRRSVLKKYGSILAFTREAGRDTPLLEWPQRDWRSEPSAPDPDRRSGVAALVNANKLSNVTGSLYGFRRNVIEAFSDSGMPLVLAGPGWRRSGRHLLVTNLKSVAYTILNHERVVWSEWAFRPRWNDSIEYLGAVDDKQAVLKASEFAVVIENSASYVSEKLFDAILAGCVPLYLGPPLSDYGIPDEVAKVVPQRAAAFPEAILGMSTSEKQRILEAGRRWLALDATYQAWAMPFAQRRVAAALDCLISTKEV